MRVEPELIEREIHIKGTTREKFPTMAHQGLQGTTEHSWPPSVCQQDLTWQLESSMTFLPLCPSFAGGARGSWENWEKKSECEVMKQRGQTLPISHSQPEATRVRRKEAFHQAQWEVWLLPPDPISLLQGRLEVAKWIYFLRFQKSHVIWTQFHHKGLERVNKSRRTLPPKCLEHIEGNESLSDINVFL